MPTTEYDINLLISSAYSRDVDKPEVQAFLSLLRGCRRYGYPIITNIIDRTLEQQISAAAKLLLSIKDSYPPEKMPRVIKPNKGSSLYRDAQLLLHIAKANKKEAFGEL